MSRGQKVTVGGIEFDKKGDAKDFLNELLKSYEPGDLVPVSSVSIQTMRNSERFAFGLR